MNERRFLFGSILTATWLLIAALILYFSAGKLAEMKPNEWGDFLAGTTAPIAFLWLVLGYLQQGHELKLSGEALQLQADELRNSVEQQRELAALTREQLDDYRKAIEPRFHLMLLGSTGSGPLMRYHFDMVNAGGPAFGLVLSPLSEISELSQRQVPIFETRGQRTVDVVFLKSEAHGLINLTYIDSLGRSYAQKIELARDQVVVQPAE